MEDLHHHLGRRSLWDKYDVPKSPTFDVTEIWGYDGSDSASCDHRTISSADVSSWLDEPAEKLLYPRTHRRLARFVWVGENPKTSRHAPSTGVLSQIIEAWSLEQASDYSRSSFAGVAALPPRGDTRIFTVTYHPKIALAWSNSTIGGVTHTQAVAFTGPEQRTEMLNILVSRWRPDVLSHPVFPAFLCSLALSGEFDDTTEGIKADVREVEVRTGHHRFSHRQERPAAGELGNLSARMSGCAAKLANGSRKLSVRDSIYTLSSSPLSPLATFQEKPNTSAATLLSHHVDVLQQRLAMQSVDNEYVRQRVQVQIAALFHLIAQQDNAIAFDTARATRELAASSQEDSSAMKMLSIVAMVFLPGSFVAALFSTPLFDWDGVSVDSSSIGIGTRPQFALFWAVTVSVTAVTFAAYLVGMIMRKRKAKRRAKRRDISV
ncbi:hypothetical protein BGZ61DRAFT_396048 [Ilyonectria robusta]|uniref:uncharacterized protein n=1 Tax=Ilyonectria robusta TaxID=1079257 RepID=UPI001E8D6110|nr:uncharacterized protein BGZ61DRAFT_396048 [Ilyonectria robusta]KAH8679216.1 hypothetical protein BGZ61DRAFT_396048 [Ilyonectria robusta]